MKQCVTGTVWNEFVKSSHSLALRIITMEEISLKKYLLNPINFTSTKLYHGHCNVIILLEYECHIIRILKHTWKTSKNDRCPVSKIEYIHGLKHFNSTKLVSRFFQSWLFSLRSDTLYKSNKFGLYPVIGSPKMLWISLSWAIWRTVSENISNKFPVFLLYFLLYFLISNY